MPLHRYSTALSYIVLSGVCLHCFKAYGIGNGRRIPLFTYGVTLANSILGVWYWGNPLHGQNVEKPYKLTQTLLTIFALPLIVTDTWLRSDYRIEVAYAHAAMSFIPLALHFVTKVKRHVLDVVIAFNVMSLSYIGFMTENYFAINAAISYAINHFILAKDRDLFNVPAEDVYNYGLCFFAYFSLRTITT